MTNVMMEYKELHHDCDSSHDVEEAKANARDRKELCITLRVFYHVLVGLLLLSMIIICTIYISHLQQHVQTLDKQIQLLQQVCQATSGLLRNIHFA